MGLLLGPLFLPKPVTAAAGAHRSQATCRDSLCSLCVHDCIVAQVLTLPAYTLNISTDARALSRCNQTGFGTRATAVALVTRRAAAATADAARICHASMDNLAPAHASAHAVPGQFDRRCATVLHAAVPETSGR